jgi:hypothetical protein
MRFLNLFLRLDELVLKKARPSASSRRKGVLRFLRLPSESFTSGGVLRIPSGSITSGGVAAF